MQNFLILNLVVRRLKRLTRIRSEKCVVRLFRSCANVYSNNLQSIAYYISRLYGIAYCL
jgi:hypothetical protein